MDRIALKVQRRRFSREAAGEIAVYQRLRERTGVCPEIIGLCEAFFFDGHICMAFEKHGNSLEPTLNRGPIPPVRVRRATRQILRALDRLHRSGYTHTDVKPGNILYSARSGDVRLADLGDAEAAPDLDELAPRDHNLFLTGGYSWRTAYSGTRYLESRLHGFRDVNQPVSF